MPPGRAEPVLAGTYDPGRKTGRAALRDRVTRAVGRHGEPVVFDMGALVVAAGFPGGRRPTPTDPVLCVADGYFESDHADPLTAVAERYAREGAEALAALRGAFAMVLWNDAEQRGCLVRDQLGERTMYLAEQGSQLYFATEIAPLLALLPRRPAPDPVGVAHFLTWTPPGENRLLYEGLRRLEHGCAVQLEHGRWSERRYWTPTYAPPLELNEDELAEMTRERLTEAIRRSIGDANRVGILLSGGIDSSSVAALASSEVAAAGGTLHTYSATFPTLETADEAAEIEAIVDFHGLEGTRMDVLGGSAFGGTLEYLDAWELPDISYNGFVARLLCKRAAADGMDIVLTGEGGDQVFATPEYLIADELARGHLGAVARLIKRFPNIVYNPWRSVPIRLFRDFGVYPLLPSPLLRILRVREQGSEPPDWASQAVMDAIRPSNRPMSWRRRGTPRWWAAKIDTLTGRKDRIGPMEVISRSARMSGITERHPINTLDLTEFALRLPPSRGFDPERNRPDLRRAMAGLLPEEIRLRAAKGSFNEVEALSLQDDMTVIRELLDDPRARIAEYTRPDLVRPLLHHTPQTWGELRRWGAEIHQLVTLETWLRYQEDSELPSRLLHSGRLAPNRVEFKAHALTG